MSRVAELVPVIDRYLWTLGCRALVTVALAVVILVSGPVGTSRSVLLAEAAGWVLLSYAAVPLVRRFRRFALMSFRLGLIGDGILLGWGWWSLGGPGSPVELLVYLHVLSATLLGSFRTGIKMALWHSMVAFVVVEAVAGLNKSADLPLFGLASYIGGLWGITVFAAAFAAVNERELRRRRYDSEVLRLLGLDLIDTQPPMDILWRLADFARDDMLVDRIAAVAYPQGGPATGVGAPATGFGVIAEPTGQHVLTELPPDAMDDCIRSAEAHESVQLVRWIDNTQNPGLAGWLPGARNVVMMPFVTEQVRGVVAVCRARRLLNLSRRVERRVVVSLHQATLQVGVALARELLNDRLRTAAEHDPLTGLANRGTFNSRLTAAVTAAHLTGRGFALVMIDLDHFKILNDTHGHQAGDEALQATARALQGQCRPEDLASRYGGEEFAVILHDLTAEEALLVATRLRLAIELIDFRVPITASIGVAVFPHDATDERTILRAADDALYQAKQAGRNRVAHAGHVIAWS